MNTADFHIRGDEYGLSIFCPECHEWIWDIASGQTNIRTLITAGSAHARANHPMSAPAVIKGA